MAVKIRLNRMGEKKHPFYRIVVGAFEQNQEINEEAFVASMEANFNVSLEAAIAMQLFPATPDLTEVEQRRFINRAIDNIIAGIQNPPQDITEGLIRQWGREDGYNNWLD